MKKLTLFIVVLFLGLNVFAQDIIVRKNPKGELNCKIVEIDNNTVKYKMIVNGEEGSFSIDKSNVEYVKYENGDVFDFEQKAPKKTDFSKDEKNAIKFNFIAPLFGYTYFSYERAVKPGISFEFGLGAIGLGGDPENIEAFGGVAKMGIKLRQTPKYHILTGGYFMPEIIFGMYEFDKDEVYYYPGYYEDNTRERTVSLGILATFGYTVVLKGAFMIEWYGSVGYGFTKHPGLNFGFLGAGNEFPIAVSTGFKFGFVF
ncbi:MAG: hypothetical protein PHN41_00395 [Bacteroidales bacterium]|jgi:hypothetical protein|nr:hypothetical protein [Bacteroidales bacterium]MDD4702736.1 hypothetical protein [Bacteroidales bacterium]MDX9798217.1 hypothetical protein [Bacteroidales bacterium]